MKLFQLTKIMYLPLCLCFQCFLMSSCSKKIIMINYIYSNYLHLSFASSKFFNLIFNFKQLNLAPGYLVLGQLMLDKPYL